MWKFELCCDECERLSSPEPAMDPRSVKALKQPWVRFEGRSFLFVPYLFAFAGGEGLTHTKVLRKSLPSRQLQGTKRYRPSYYSYRGGVSADANLTDRPHRHLSYVSQRLLTNIAKKSRAFSCCNVSKPRFQTDTSRSGAACLQGIYELDKDLRLGLPVHCVHLL